MKNKFFLVFILVSHLLMTELAYSTSFPNVIHCEEKKMPDTYILLCENIDDVICKKIPDKLRRSCDGRGDSIVRKEMSAEEVYQFSKGCFKSAIHSFPLFFTEFLPELCKAIIEINKEFYGALLKPKGSYESAKSFMSDTYEAVQKNPGEVFAQIWSKIVDAIGPVVANYDCLNPQAKVEKICEVAAEWVMPPVILAKVIVKGFKAAKELIAAKELLTAKELVVAEELVAAEELVESTKLVESPSGETSKINKNTEVNTPQQQVLDLKKYIKAYSKDLHLKANSNKDFITKMGIDSQALKPNTLYFDVENSVQKTLNDSVFVNKDTVDAINNSFFIKLNENLRKDPELIGRLDGEYKDYKSYRLRLNLKPGDDPKVYEERLSSLYKKTNLEFSADLSRRKITQQISPRNDGINDTTSWFLAGAGGNPLEANMAARAARNAKGKPDPQGKPLSLFSNHMTTLHNDLNEIENLRQGLSQNKDLVKAKVIEEISPGKIIPSPSMISILRKIKPSEFQTPEEYIAKVKSKAKDIFGYDLNDKTVIDLTNYFKKVDAISPPLFSPERVVIQLDKADNGIVSVDFAGIGVDNIQQQMKQLSEVELKNTSPEVALRSSFRKMQNGVDQVTKDMNKAKDDFSKSIAKVEGPNGNSPLFSGDDGIHMPSEKKWEAKDKIALVQELAKGGNPSKYRITFVSTHFPDGKVIPSVERSKRIVRAETIEKEIRANVSGIKKINEANAKNLLIAVDYAPKETGGIFNLIISGGHLSSEEINLVRSSFEKTISKENGESIGEMIVK